MLHCPIDTKIYAAQQQGGALLHKASRILLKHFCWCAVMVLISAAFILESGATSAKATAAATDLIKATPDIKTTAQSPAAAAAKLAPGTKININTADKATLEKLPEIGPVKAQAIIDGRPYKFVEDVMRVSGIKDKTFKVIKDYITVK
jgi:competence ComEA-like helix-hairpin-helix protein